MSQIDEIKNRLNIVDVIGEYIQFKKAGTNYKALCPFHNEKTPSFLVSSEKQIWHCFGCSEGGDIFGFVQKMEGVEFPEALRILAKKAGVELRHESPEHRNRRAQLLDILNLAARFYHKIFLESEKARSVREYAKQRGFTQMDIDDFIIGYSPDDWDTLLNFLTKKGYSEEEIFQAGLTIKREKGIGYYNRFRGRLMFPIHDVHGNVVGFGGRALAEGEGIAKYVNSPQSEIYNKSRVVYGLFKAKQSIRRQKAVMVVEGYTDVIACHRHGITNVVASSGTALTEGQLDLLKRYSDRIIMAFDRDSAGQEAAKRGIELALSLDMSVWVLQVPGGKDPDECLKQNPESFKQAIKRVKPYLEYLFNNVFSGLNLDDVDNKKQAAKELLPWIAKIANPIEKSHWIAQLAKKLSISEEVARESLVKIKTRQLKNSQSAENTPPAKKDKYKTIAQEILAILLFFPQLIEQIVSELSSGVISNPEINALYRNIVVYYTKSKEFNFNSYKKYLIDQEETSLISLLDTIALLAENIFSDYTEDLARAELKKRINILKQSQLKQQLAQIQKRIKVLEETTAVENSSTKEEQVALSEEFIKLTDQLKSLE